MQMHPRGIVAHGPAPAYARQRLPSMPEEVEEESGWRVPGTGYRPLSSSAAYGGGRQTMGGYAGGVGLGLRGPAVTVPSERERRSGAGGLLPPVPRGGEAAGRVRVPGAYVEDCSDG